MNRKVYGFNAKRRQKELVGVEAWYPYYAGYSESFAKDVLSSRQLPKDAVILDPWNGCGTTTRVADSLGYTAIGVDINPVATLVASAKLVHPDDAYYVLGLVSSLAEKSSYVNGKRAKPNDPLRGWLCPAVIIAYREIEQGVLDNLANRDGEVVRPSDAVLPPLAAFLVLALQKAARKFAGIKTTTNPTWLRKLDQPPRFKAKDFVDKWVATVAAMGSDLKSCGARIPSTSSKIYLGDSKDLPLHENTVDMIVTSPPYCTRIDYVVNTSFELALLGVKEDDYDALRRRSMGTPLSRRLVGDSGETSLPEAVFDVLNSIRMHKSKSSGSYYYNTYKQYFSDSVSSIREIKRVLKPGGLAAVVVQSSYYKDIYVDLPQLYVEMAREISMNASIASEYSVSRFLGQINSRSSVHRKDTSHSEAVIFMEVV